MNGVQNFIRRTLRALERDSRGAQTSWVALALTLTAVAAGELGRRIYRDRRVLLPSSEPLLSWTPADYGLPPEAVEELRFEGENRATIHGWYCRAEQPVASVFYCHGNKGNITWSANVLPHFLRLGISVFLFDYRGFGRSTGRATARGTFRDALAAARLHDQLRPAGVPSIAYGFSLGGPIAAATARTVQFDGLVLQSTFTTLSDIARNQHPRTPMHLVTGSVFDTMRSVRQLTIPILIIHGEKDEICPVAMAHSLFEVCRNPWRLHIVENAIHNNVHNVAGHEVRQLIREFSSSLPTRPRRLEPFPVETDSTLPARVRRLLRRQVDRLGIATS